MFVEPIYRIRRICENQSCQKEIDKLVGIDAYELCVNCLSKYADNCSSDLIQWIAHLQELGNNLH